MKIPGYYTSGEFARMAQVSVRTIRFYDKQNILKPSYVNASGARFYSDSDFAKLQQILLLKYLGFSLEDIKELSIDTTDYHFMLNSLNLQKQLIQDKIEQMKLVEEAIEDTVCAIEEKRQLDWSHMLELIHLTGMEKSLKTQYVNASNISARIRLHKEYSVNKQGWFPWIYENCGLTKVNERYIVGDYAKGAVEDKVLPKAKSDIESETQTDTESATIHCTIDCKINCQRILELGCGNGALWKENMQLLPENISIVLSDISEGMIRDARRCIGQKDERFVFEVIDCNKIPYENESFDMVIANHLLFYCGDIPSVLKEIKRVLKKDGKFICSTYGSEHMKEITELVQKFDSRILLSGEKLFEKFGLNNGKELLEESFDKVECRKYEDFIELQDSEPLIEYILSCHGNQNQILLDRYKEFKSFVEKKINRGFRITKDAGIFICNK